MPWKDKRRKVGDLWDQAEDALKGNVRHEGESPHGRKYDVHVPKGGKFGDAVKDPRRIVRKDR
jgi:hypothetical protein